MHILQVCQSYSWVTSNTAVDCDAMIPELYVFCQMVSLFCTKIKCLIRLTAMASFWRQLFVKSTDWLIEGCYDYMKTLHTLGMTAPCHGKTNPIVILFTVCYAVFVIYHLPSKVSFFKKVSVAYCWLCLKCKIIYVLTENLCFE